MTEGHFSHLVYHLPICFKQIFHLVLTFVIFCPYRFSTHLSHHSLETTLPLLTKPISQPPEMNFERSKQNLSTRQRVEYLLRAASTPRGQQPYMNSNATQLDSRMALENTLRHKGLSGTKHLLALSAPRALPQAEVSLTR